MMRKCTLNSKFSGLKGKTMRFLFLLPLLVLSFIVNQANAQNYAVNFDGTTGQQINISPMIPYTADFTVMAWVNITANNSNIFTWGSPSVNKYVKMEVYSNKLRYYVGGGGASISANQILVNQGWYHIAVTKSSNQVTIYIDGIEKGSGTHSTVINPTASSMGAALLNGSIQGKCTGTIDDMSVWNSALSSVDIVNYMNSSPDGSEAGIVTLYDFNNPAVIPEGANTSETTLTDVSGNGYTGTLVGFPLTGTTGNWVGAYVPPTAPILTTTAVSAITDLTAISGGDITDNGGELVTARGICWNTTGNPTIADNTTSDGLGIGAFISELSALSEETTYYVRAYATNSIGTAYGNEEVFDTLATNPTVPVSDWGLVIGMMLILGVTLVSVRKSIF